MTATASSTISAFILARVDADETAARAAISATADATWSTLTYRVVASGEFEVADASVPVASHIATHDPARVLAQCAAFRAIVEEHGANRYRVDPCDAHDASFQTIPCPTLRALASIWRDHDEFQEAWL